MVRRLVVRASVRWPSLSFKDGLGEPSSVYSRLGTSSSVFPRAPTVILPLNVISTTAIVDPTWSILLGLSCPLIDPLTGCWLFRTRQWCGLHLCSEADRQPPEGAAQEGSSGRRAPLGLPLRRCVSTWSACVTIHPERDQSGWSRGTAGHAYPRGPGRLGAYGLPIQDVFEV